MKKLLDNKIFQITKKILETLLTIILVLYVGFVVVQRLSGNKSIKGYRVFTVATGSMIPVYNVNDVILVKDCDTSTLKVGDDVAYRGTRGGMEGLLVTHRIIKIDKDETGSQRIFTKGVNNKVADPSISPSQVIGKVGGKVPVITQLNHVVKNQFGFFFLVFCPLVLVIFLEVCETIIDIKVDKNELRKIEKPNKGDIKTEKEKIEEVKTEKVKAEEVNSLDQLVSEEVRVMEDKSNDEIFDNTLIVNTKEELEKDQNNDVVVLNEEEEDEEII